jgi:hypothetical protein
MVCPTDSTTPIEGTITNIPLKSATGSDDTEAYLVLLDNGKVTPAIISEL